MDKNDKEKDLEEISGRETVQPLVLSARQEWEMKLAEKHPHKTFMGLLVLAWAPHLYNMATSETPEKAATHLGLALGIFAAISVPYLREVPLALSRIFLRTLIVRGVKEPPQPITNMFNELAKNAGLKHVKLYQCDKGFGKDNAVVLGGTIYIGKELLESCDSKEVEFILAHELSHAKNYDMSKGYLALVPYWSSILGLIELGTQYLATGAKPAAAGALAMGMIYMMYQQKVFRFAQRQMEYRADSGAVELAASGTEPAISTLCKFALKGGGALDHNDFSSSHPNFAARHENILQTGDRLEEKRKTSKGLDFHN